MIKTPAKLVEKTPTTRKKREIKRNPQGTNMTGKSGKMRQDAPAGAPCLKINARGFCGTARQDNVPG